MASIDSLYIGDDRVSIFKRKAFKDYGGWLDNREFNTEEELQTQLQLDESEVEYFLEHLEEQNVLSLAE